MVLARAVQLAGVHAAHLVVLHVIDSEQVSQVAAHMRLGEGEWQERLKRQAVAAVEPWLEKAGCSGNAEVQVEFGTPHEAITRAGRERAADVLVLGAGKGQTLKLKVLGSTADRVVRTSSVPVLVARQAVTGPYVRAAVAIDMSPLSARALLEVRRLAPDAKLQLLHAVEVPLPFQQAMFRTGMSSAEMERYRAALEGKAREELKAFQRRVVRTDDLPVRLLTGDPGPALVRAANSGRFDLVALGSRGHSATLQALLGSVARRLLAEARCDVLVATTQRSRSRGAGRRPRRGDA